MKGLRFVAGTWLSAFAMWGSLLAIAPILGQVSDELGLSKSQLGLVFSIPVLVLAILAFGGGMLTDRFGPRRVGTVGLVLVGFGGLLRAYSNDFGSLLLFSGVFGVGWSLSFPTLPKVVGGWFDKTEAGTATGVYSIGLYIGAGLATAVEFANSWRPQLAFWGIITLVIAFSWWVLIRDPTASERERRKLREVVGNRRLWALTLLFFFGANVTFYTLTGWLPAILATYASQTTAAFVASFLSFFAIPVTLVVPWLVGKFGRRRSFLLVACAAGTVGSYVLFNAPLGLQAAAVVILGVSISAIFVICLTMPLELVGERLVGTATGFMLIAYTGGILGPSLSGLTQDVTSSFTPTMAILIVSFVVSAVLVFFLPSDSKGPG